VPVSAGFRVVTFASDDVGWVAGSGATVLRTEDGGATWTELQTSWTDDVVVGCTLGADQVALATERGVFASTAPDHWRVVLGADLVLDLDFVDADNGSVLYLDESVPHIGTVAGGVWTHRALDLPRSARCLAVSGQDLTVAGWDGMLVHSADGGGGWNLVTRRLDNPDPFATQLFDVAFAGPELGLAVGTAGTILRTANGGVSWTVQESAVTGDLRAVAIVPGGTALAVGVAGTATRSTDGGLTWAPLTLPDTDLILYDVAFWGAERGLVVGSSANRAEAIFVTHDGGTTWETVDRGVDPSAEIATLCVTTVGDQRAWIGGAAGTFLTTGDGGATWSARSADAVHASTSLFFSDAVHGWSTTAQGQFLRTSDGGTTWEVFSGTVPSLRRVHFVDAQVGIGVASTGKVWRTEDGGANWSQTHAGWSTWSHVRAVWMTSPTDGVIVGTETKILYTRTGGLLPD
jgi:photosystem II stability/assembly factor-like uncharacterized protein